MKLKISLVALIRIYQKTISLDHGPMRKFFPGEGNIICRYYPTCSEYMEGAIMLHGPLKGVFLGCKRILRCHPWSNHPIHDPVV